MATGNYDVISNRRNVNKTLVTHVLFILSIILPESQLLFINSFDTVGRATAKACGHCIKQKYTVSTKVLTF